LQQIKISELFIYPIKSTTGYNLKESIVEHVGLKYDRNFAIINADRTVLTARENPSLLKITSRFSDTKLTLKTDDKDVIVIDVFDVDKNEESVILFKDEVSAKISNHNEVNQWISSVIGEPSKLIQIDGDSLRKIKPKYNGGENDLITFSDISPVHLITQESLDDLNSKLENLITVTNFRPNMVVTGCKPYEEKNWKFVQIGECIFDVAIETPRCTFSTINPITREKDTHQEPLRTLSKNRKEGERINFGIYLTPKKLGVVRLGDELKITKWK